MVLEEQSFASGCPIASALELVGDRWSLVIVRTLAFGPKRFRDLLEMPEGIATNILSARLRRLEACGLVAGAAEAARRGARRYALTRAGAELVPVLQAFARWGVSNLPGRWTPPDSFWDMTAETVAAA